MDRPRRSDPRCELRQYLRNPAQHGPAWGGFPNPGAWPVLGGNFKGRAVETKQRKLSNWLVRHLGQPEKYKGGPDAKAGIGARHGIVSFFQLHGPADHQGHIDIVMMDRWNKYQRCGSNNDDAGGCYWDAVDVWFWPLK